jgi:hypothetical protein
LVGLRTETLRKKKYRVLELTIYNAVLLVIFRRNVKVYDNNNNIQDYASKFTFLTWWYIIIMYLNHPSYKNTIKSIRTNNTLLGSIYLLIVSLLGVVSLLSSSSEIIIYYCPDTVIVKKKIYIYINTASGKVIF